MTPSPSSQSLSIQAIDSASGAKIFKLTGPLTIQNLYDFQNMVRQEVTKPIIVDISQVPYIDSAGLGCVVSAYTSCQRNHRSFGITGLTERIRTLFSVTHVDGLLPCFDSLEAAEASVTNSGR